MRKRLKKLAGLCLLLALLLALPAGARAATDDIVSLTIDRCISGNDYTLLVLRPGTDVAHIDTGDILFMDMFTAWGSEIHLGFYYPDFQAFDAAAGGVFSGGEASPRKLGSYKLTRMPEDLSVVGEGAFEGTAFTHIFLGESVTTIESRAFANCPKLESIYIPGSVESIAEDAFAGSPRVTIVSPIGSAAESFALAHNLICRPPAND